MLRLFRAGTFLSFASLAALAGFGLGCARGPDVAVTGLGLKRVVIYRNGVGYFERAGHVDEDRVTFRVRKEKVGDFLATLAVIEAGGSSVRSASFPVEVADDADDDDSNGRFEVLLKPPSGPKAPPKDKLETVKLTLDGKEHDLVIGYVAETPVWRPSYRLVLTSKAGAGAKGGATGPGTADLQAWGIVQNLSGEDWKNVALSLVAGAPLAFQATLDKAVIPPRPVVTDQGEVIAAVPVGETSLAEAPPPPPPPPPAPAAEAAPGGYGGMARLEEAKDEDEQQSAKKGKGSGASKAKKAPSRAPRRAAEMPSSSSYAQAMPMAPMPAQAPPPPAMISRPRNVGALAAIAMEGGTTRYVLPFPVDVPNNSATMVLLTARPVPGESSFLYSPDGGVPDSSSHPFRVVRFTNDGKGMLERGPIAVFEDSTFLGQGMIDPLPPGATATVPFALERGIAVESARTSHEEGARLAQIEGGRIEIERDWVTQTKYTVKNGGEDAAKVLVKHPRLAGTRLFQPPKGTDDNIGTGSALIPSDVGPHATVALDVDERQVLRRSVSWLDPLADDAVKAYIADPRADKDMVTKLKAAWEARTKLRAVVDERDKLSGEKSRLDEQVAQLNASLKAIEKNKVADQLRKDLSDRLSKASARLDELTKRLVVVEMTFSEQDVRFRDLVSDIHMVKPLPLP